jgi:hypothetical protein
VKLDSLSPTLFQREHEAQEMLYLNTSSDTLSFHNHKKSIEELDILHLSIRILLSWLLSGSFGISGTELATIASLLLPITIILFDNGSFGLMKMLQRLYYDNKWYLGFDFTNTTHTASIAEAFGLRSVRIPDPDHLCPVMTEALASNEPVFIDISKKLITPVQAYSMLKICCSA